LWPPRATKTSRKIRAILQPDRIIPLSHLPDFANARTS
jgi:hypothetical protein